VWLVIGHPLLWYEFVVMGKPPADLRIGRLRRRIDADAPVDIFEPR
jgi:hypothetical protein